MRPSSPTGTPRSVLITGCSSGIGRATAEHLRVRGWQVFPSARSVADVAALRAAGFEAVVLDLDDSDSIAAALESVLAATGGRLDALVNNAGLGVPGAIEDLPRAAWRRQFETNLFGVAELTARVVPVMRAQGSGRIVMISSILGLVAMPLRGAYNASKFALEGLTDTLRLELRGTGIRVMSINPGAIESRFREHAMEQATHWLPDRTRSAHAATYARLAARNASPGGKMPFSRPPRAVAEDVAHALESRWPRTRYLVTLPAHVLAFLKRLLPHGWLDRVLART
jgi:NAD(P)-dependent dehydrogenase (short-subunit alcohol dehydrogenase family)